jgi:hypothetical protein
MLKLMSVAVAGVFGVLLFVPGAFAGSKAGLKCKASDKAGTWEVVISHAATKASASSIAAAAVKKGLKATAERDGCSKRYEVVVTAATKAKATTMMATAKKDGYTAATLEAS